MLHLWPLSDQVTAGYFYHTFAYEICFYGIYIYEIYIYRALKFLTIDCTVVRNTWKCEDT